MTRGKTKRLSTKEMEKIEILARQKVGRRFGLLTHFFVYIVVNSFFLGYDHIVTTQADWSYIPLFVWGTGLFVHGLIVVFGDFFSNWKERAVDNEMEKIISKK